MGKNSIVFFSSVQQEADKGGGGARHLSKLFGLQNFNFSNSTVLYHQDNFGKSQFFKKKNLKFFSTFLIFLGIYYDLKIVFLFKKKV